MRQASTGGDQSGSCAPVQPARRAGNHPPARPDLARRDRPATGLVACRPSRTSPRSCWLRAAARSGRCGRAVGARRRSTWRSIPTAASPSASRSTTAAWCRARRPHRRPAAAGATMEIEGLAPDEGARRSSSGSPTSLARRGGRRRRADLGGRRRHADAVRERRAHRVRADVDAGLAARADRRTAVGVDSAIPVVVENDATAAAVGEQFHGAGRRLRDFFYVYIGVGVGGGMILSGHPYRGSAGRAGELGHVVVEPGGRPCACGNRGCLERYASLSAAQHALDGRPEGGTSRTRPLRTRRPMAWAHGSTSRPSTFRRPASRSTTC